MGAVEVRCGGAVVAVVVLAVGVAVMVALLALRPPAAACRRHHAGAVPLLVGEGACSQHGMATAEPWLERGWRLMQVPSLPLGVVQQVQVPRLGVGRPAAAP